MNNFPTSWASFSIKEALAPLPDGKLLHQGWSPRCETYPSPSELDWAVLKTTAIQDGQFLPTHNKALSESLRPKPELEVHAGDLLITCAGPRVRCGVPCLVRKSRPRLMISGKMYRFRVREPEIDSRYFEAVLRSPDIQYAIDKLKTGISESGLNLTHERFFGIHIPIAPSSEQRRIVAKLDSLCTRTFRARIELDRIPKLVERYKRVILAKAFSGELTADWRGPSQRIHLSERNSARLDLDDKERGTWETSILPEGWTWKTFPSIFIDQTDSTRKLQQKAYEAEGLFPVVDQGETFIGGFTSDASLVSKSTPPIILFGDHTRCVKYVDFRFVQGADGTKVLKPAKGIEPRYAYFALLALTLPDKGYSRHMKFLRESLFPYCSLGEQQEIVRRIGSAFNWLDRIAVEHERAQHLLPKLDQAILAKAFRGELVSQDPNDEPAAKLLEPIRAERAKQPHKKWNGKRVGQTR